MRGSFLVFPITDRLQKLLISKCIHAILIGSPTRCKSRGSKESCFDSKTWSSRYSECMPTYFPPDGAHVEFVVPWGHLLDVVPKILMSVNFDGHPVSRAMS